DLLLVGVIRVVVVGAEPAERVSAVVRGGAGAGGDGKRARARALRGEERVGLGDHSRRRSAAAGGPDLKSRVKRGGARERLQLVLLPFRGPGEQDQSGRSD